MNAATLLAIFFVPVLFFVVERIAQRKSKHPGAPEPHPATFAGSER
jgi:hypothetical protein